MSSPRAATPNGTAERRFRGATFGSGANVTLCWTGSEEEDVSGDWLPRIPLGEDIEESMEFEGHGVVGISTDNGNGFWPKLSGGIMRRGDHP